MKALIVIGMQIDLMPGGPAEVPHSQKLVPILNRTMGFFDLVVAANFWMQATHARFAANHLWRYPGQEIEIKGAKMKLHHIFGVAGSFGAELMPDLLEGKIAFIAEMGTEKHLPPHSAFFDADKKRDTSLAAFLAEKEVTDVFLAGVPLEEEVKNTALDALELGFKTYLIKDACLGRSDGEVEKTLDDLALQGVEILPLHGF